jgi:hypothetical protein
LDFDSQEVKRAIRALKEVGFELAYLALLTREGIKPLSRWEKPLEDHALELLRELGLLSRRIMRTVKTGKEVTETVFGLSPGYLELYEKRFGGRPIEKSAAAVRFEGFLFGFPPCCVDQFIRRPYAKNGLDPQRQKILFHWACNGCKITPLLWPAYKAVNDYLITDDG